MREQPGVGICASARVVNPALDVGPVPRWRERVVHAQRRDRHDRVAGPGSASVGLKKGRGRLPQRGCDGIAATPECQEFVLGPEILRRDREDARAQARRPSAPERSVRWSERLRERTPARLRLHAPKCGPGPFERVLLDCRRARATSDVEPRQTVQRVREEGALGEESLHLIVGAVVDRTIEEPELRDRVGVVPKRGRGLDGVKPNDHDDDDGNQEGEDCAACPPQDESSPCRLSGCAIGHSSIRRPSDAASELGVPRCRLAVSEDRTSGRSGAQLNYSNLATDVRVSVDTMRRWIDSLCSLHHGFLIRPWFANLARALRKEPKWFLRDWSTIRDPGARCETFVACHLLKAVETWTDMGFGDYELRYIRDKERREVDFVVVRDGTPWFLVEAKRGKTALSPALEYFRTRTRAEHAFQVTLDMPYVAADCGERATSCVVPAQTFLSQLP